MDQAATPPAFHFAGFALDQARACLRGADGAEIALRPKAFDLLLFLARNPGRAVTKDALLEAVWPGVHVGEDSLFQAVHEARRAIGDEAGKLLRNIPRRGYMLDVAVTGASPVAVAPLPSGAESDRPSIAVLPFANLGDDPAQAYFADGVTDEITIALSRFRNLLVIARSSAFTFKGQQPDVREVGKALGVRYVLEGSVRRAGDRLRISGQLVEAATGAHLWADRFEGPADDLFALQDRVTEAVAAALEPRIQQLEIERAKRRPTNDPSAYDLYLRAMAQVHAGTAAGNNAAIPLLEQAISCDPGFARASAHLAMAFSAGLCQGWHADPVAAQARSVELARQALALDGTDPFVIAMAGFALAVSGRQHALGGDLIGRAVTLNPNLADAEMYGGWVAIFDGEPEFALTRLRRAERLNPVAPNVVRLWTGYGAAHLFGGRFAESAAQSRRAIARAPGFPPARAYLVVALVQLGAVEEARSEMRMLRDIQPSRTIRLTRQTNPYRVPWMLDMYLDSLRTAGMPEE